MQLQYRENPNTWSSHWKGTSLNRIRQDKRGQGIKDTNKNQESRKLSRTCKFLQEVHPELQSYGKTIERVERKRRNRHGQKNTNDIQEIKGKDNKSTCIFPSKKRR